MLRIGSVDLPVQSSYDSLLFYSQARQNVGRERIYHKEVG
jgi:hypothetical protein